MPFRSFGKVDIQGGAYRYRPNGDVVGGFQPYSVGGGQIQWSGHFGVIDDAPSRILGSTVETWGFNVKFQSSPGGLIVTMSCHAPTR